jgi:lysozyme
MSVSNPGVAFIESHEGTVLKAYRCPAGVVTIGNGFTMGSRVFADFWRAKHGRGLQMGDTITREECRTILKALLDDEYGAAVKVRLGSLPQHQHDGATSVSFNCGTGALVWKWAAALKNRLVSESATLLRSTAVTANGRQLAGLVRRRKEEARLIETGDYGVSGDPKVTTPAAISTAPADVKQYQEQLKALGYAVTVNGSVLSSDAAVRKFQGDHGLTVDGKVGPATRAALIRAIDAKNTKNATAAGGATGGAAGTGDAATTIDPAAADIAMNALLWGATAAVVIGLAFILYRYRGALFGHRVPT